MMSKPSNFLQRPSPIIIQRQTSKKLMCPDEQLITRELSNISNEGGYHGGETASVPFVWESQPGTPKVKVRESSLPPLTPPPSYQQNAPTKPTIKAKNKIKNNSPKASLLQNIFPKLGTRKVCVPSPPPDLSYSSSSSLSSMSSSSSSRRPAYSAPPSPMVRSRKGEEDKEDDVRGMSLCFGNTNSRGSYSSMFKKALLGDIM